MQVPDLIDFAWGDKRDITPTYPNSARLNNFEAYLLAASSLFFPFVDQRMDTCFVNWASWFIC